MNSLIDFFLSDVSSFIHTDNESQVIDSGSGLNSIFEELNIKGSIKAIDQKIQAKNFKNIEYVNADIIEYLKGVDTSSIDLFFDSHLIHCLTNFETRKNYLYEVQRTLKAFGFFSFQSMVKKRNSDPYDLFKDRILLSSFEIENELLKVGLKIKLFKIIPNLEYIDDYSKKFSCDLLRCICTK